MKFEAYSVKDRKKRLFEVQKKIVTNVRGHLTYTLIGKTEDNCNMSALVNKQQWDQFDVPIEQRKIDKVINRKYKRKQMLKPKLKPAKRILKDKKYVYNNEIEEWLIKHYDLNLDEIK